MWKTFWHSSLPLQMGFSLIPRSSFCTYAEAAIGNQSLSQIICPLRRTACCLLVKMLLSVDQIWALRGANNTARSVVVRHLGARGVSVSRAANRTAGVHESAEILGVDRLVALQHSDGFVNLEPLPLPPSVSVYEGPTSPNPSTKTMRPVNCQLEVIYALFKLIPFKSKLSNPAWP